MQILSKYIISRSKISLILLLEITLEILCWANNYPVNSAYATAYSAIALSLSSSPKYDQKTQKFTVYGVLDNASDLSLDNVSLQLIRSSRIDRIADLPSERNNWNFQPQFISAPVHIDGQVKPHSHTKFTIISSMNPQANNFLHLPSPGVFGFKVLATYTSPENQVPHSHLEDTFSYTFPHWKDIIKEENSVSPDKPALPELTFISFHAQPSLAPGYPGGEQSVTLKNSDLINSLSHGLLARTLSAVEKLITHPADSHTFCLSIDPDLLVTVNALTQGYMIANTVYPPSAIAYNWLERLRYLAKLNCVVSEPFSNVDLNFIAHSQLSDLYPSSIMGADLIHNILETHINPKVIYTGQQVLGPAAINLLHNLGIRTLIGQTNVACPDDMRCLSINFRNSLYPWRSHKPVESALAAVARLHLDILHSQDDRQPIIIGIEPSLDTNSLTLNYLLRAINNYYVSHQFTAVDMTGYFRQKPSPAIPSKSIFPAYSANNGIYESQYFHYGKATLELPHTVLNTINILLSLSHNTRDEKAAITFYSPLREDILRAYSVLGKIPGRANLRRHTDYAKRELRFTAAALTQISDQIQVLRPTTTYTLTSHKSPLIIAIKNGLPLTIRVNVMVRAPQGFSVQNKDTIVIPPLSERQLKLPTYSAFSRYTSILVQLQSTMGILLNSPIQISIYANAYGHWFVYIAITAGSILVLLLLRRLYLRLCSRNRLPTSRKPNPTPEQKRFTVSPLRLKRSAHASRFSDRDDF